MKQLMYQSVKIAFGVAAASILASIIGLNYYTTAGIITLLSILSTRRQTYITGLKRVASAAIAILVASGLFTLWGHETYVLGLFLLIFIPLSTLLNNTEGISVSTVLVTHIYSLRLINLSVFTNEMLLLIIGILVAWLMNLHMPNIKESIKERQLEVEGLMKEALNNLHLLLLNQTTSSDTLAILARLKESLITGKALAMDYNNNFLLRDEQYYIEYFQMRKEQYLLLKQITKHFETVFFNVSQASELSQLTSLIRDNLSECNDGTIKLNAANALLAKYKESPLPTSREEFEHRAVLYQYLADIKRFIQIKADFIAQYGTIKYCSNSID